MLSEQDHERLRHFRIEALANAVRHRIREESTDEIVAAAQKYFEFLRGDLPAK